MIPTAGRAILDKLGCMQSVALQLSARSSAWQKRNKHTCPCSMYFIDVYRVCVHGRMSGLRVAGGAGWTNTICAPNTTRQTVPAHTANCKAAPFNGQSATQYIQRIHVNVGRLPGAGCSSAGAVPRSRLDAQLLPADAAPLAPLAREHHDKLLNHARFLSPRTL